MADTDSPCTQTHVYARGLLFTIILSILYVSHSLLPKEDNYKLFEYFSIKDILAWSFKIKLFRDFVGNFNKPDYLILDVNKQNAK